MVQKWKMLGKDSRKMQGEVGCGSTPIVWLAADELKLAAANHLTPGQDRGNPVHSRPT